jgi:hypothetical protein
MPGITAADPEEALDSLRACPYVVFREDLD